jgi:hypothetical protein
MESGQDEESDDGLFSVSNDIFTLKEAFHRLSKRLVFIETFLKDKFRTSKRLNVLFSYWVRFVLNLTLTFTLQCMNS